MPIYFIDIPFEERLEHIVKGYGQVDKENLIIAIMPHQKRLGPLETETGINLFWKVIQDCVADG